MSPALVRAILVAAAAAAGAVSTVFPKYGALLQALATFLAGVAVPTPGKPAPVKLSEGGNI